MSFYEKPENPFLRYPPVNYRQLPATPGHTLYNTTYSPIASTRSPAFGDQYYWRYSPEFEVLLGFPQYLLKSNSRNQLGHLPGNELLLEMGNSKLYYPIFQMRLFWKKQPYRFGVIPSNQILQLSIWVSSRQYETRVLFSVLEMSPRWWNMPSLHFECQRQKGRLLFRQYCIGLAHRIYCRCRQFDSSGNSYSTPIQVDISRKKGSAWGHDTLRNRIKNYRSASELNNIPKVQPPWLF